MDKALFIAIVGLLQWHGATFWLEATGITGAVFSVLLEAVALRMWYKGVTWLAGLCSLLVILGPLYAVGSPVIGAMAKNEVDQKIIASYETEIGMGASLAQIDIKNLDRLREAAAARKDAKEALEAYRDTLKATPTTIAWLEWAKVGIQALGLVLLQWGQIVLVRGLKNNRVHAIIKAVAAGDFNDAPGVEAIKERMGATRDEVKQAFAWLIKNGYMQVKDKKISLIKQGKVDFG